MALAVGLESAGVEPNRDALRRLHALVGDDLAAVNRVIVERMHSPVALIPQLAGHLTASGGKRLRPLVTLLAARMCGYGGERHIPLAACIEFIHTATLLHDDVVDASALRRGSATANAVWGNQASVLVGDFLLSRAFEMMVEDGALEVLSILARASAVIAEGEVTQMMTSNDTSTTQSVYLEVITAKTARLFAAAAEIGAVVADRPTAERQALFEYGLNLGISFQLIDDGLDYGAAQVTLGKSIGDDFREGKVTLPVLLAYARGTAEDREFWRRTIEQGRQREGDLSHAIDLLNRSEAIADTVARARAYGERARSALGGFAAGDYRDALVETIDFAIERAY